MLELFLFTWMSPLEFLEITFSFHLQNIRMAILYHPGHPGTDRAFMEEFGQFLEILSVPGKVGDLW